MRVLAALLLVCSVASAQEVKMPQAVTVAPYRLAEVEMSYDGEDFAYSVAPELDAFREFTTDPKVVKLRVQFVPRQDGPQSGTFLITAVAAKAVNGVGRLSKFQTCLVTVAGPTPPPGPGPRPPVPPDPTPAGQRSVIILRETGNSNARLAPLLTSLGLPPHHASIEGKGHKLHILDVDLPGSVGEDWKPHVVGMTLPVLVIYDAKNKTVLAKEPLPSTAEAIIDILKKHGG
jgi:hypothetical protein